MHREAALVLVLFALKILQFASGRLYAGGSSPCEGLLRSLGPNAGSLRTYLRQQLEHAVPGVLLRDDVFQCTMDQLGRWPASELAGIMGRLAQLAEAQRSPLFGGGGGQSQAQLVLLLWLPTGVPETLAQRSALAARMLLLRELPVPVVQKYEALFEDARRWPEVRSVVRSLTEHVFDCRRPTPNEEELSKLPVSAMRNVLLILSHFASLQSCSGPAPGAMLSMRLPGGAGAWPNGISSSMHLTWDPNNQPAVLLDRGYPRALGLQETDAADYSRARTLEKFRAYHDMLRFIRESMRNATLSSLSVQLLLKIGTDLASSCQPPKSSVFLLREILSMMVHNKVAAQEDQHVFSQLLLVFQDKLQCTKVSIRDLMNAHDYLVPQLLEDFQKSVLFESPSVRSYLVTELSVYASMTQQLAPQRRAALLGVATALLTISWPPGKVLDLLIDSAILLQVGPVTQRLAQQMIPALMRIHTRPYYEWLSPERKTYLYVTLLQLIGQLDRMDDAILVAIENVVASPCDKLNLVSVLFRMLQSPTISSKVFSYIECLILYLLKVQPGFTINITQIIIPTVPTGPCHHNITTPGTLRTPTPSSQTQTVTTPTPFLSTSTVQTFPSMTVSQRTPSVTSTETSTVWTTVPFETTQPTETESPTATASVETSPQTTTTYATETPTGTFSVATPSETVPTTESAATPTETAAIWTPSQTASTRLTETPTGTPSVETPTIPTEVPTGTPTWESPFEVTSTTTFTEAPTTLVPTETSSEMPTGTFSTGTQSTLVTETPSGTASERTTQKFSTTEERPTGTPVVTTPLETAPSRTSTKTSSVGTPSQTFGTMSVETPTGTQSVKSSPHISSTETFTPTGMSSVTLPSETTPAATSTETPIGTTLPHTWSQTPGTTRTLTQTPSGGTPLQTSTETPTGTPSVETPTWSSSLITETPTGTFSVGTPTQTTMGTPSKLTPSQTESSTTVSFATPSVKTPSQTASIRTSGTPTGTGSYGITPSVETLTPTASTRMSRGTPTTTLSVGTPSQTATTATPSVETPLQSASTAMSRETPTATASESTLTETISTAASRETSTATVSIATSRGTPTATPSVETQSQTLSASTSQGTPTATRSIATAPSEETPSQTASTATPSVVTSISEGTPSKTVSTWTPKETPTGTASTATSKETPTATASTATTISVRTLSQTPYTKTSKGTPTATPSIATTLSGTMPSQTPSSSTSKETPTATALNATTLSVGTPSLTPSIRTSKETPTATGSVATTASIKTPSQTSSPRMSKETPIATTTSMRTPSWTPYNRTSKETPTATVSTATTTSARTLSQMPSTRTSKETPKATPSVATTASVKTPSQTASFKTSTGTPAATSSIGTTLPVKTPSKHIITTTREVDYHKEPTTKQPYHTMRYSTPPVTIFTTESFTEMGTTEITLPTPTLVTSVFTVPPNVDVPIRFNIEKISHHVTSVNLTGSNLLGIIEELFNSTHPKDIKGFILNAHNITLVHPEIRIPVEEKVILVIVGALTERESIGIHGAEVEFLIRELYEILKTGVRFRLEILQKILTLEITGTLKANILNILIKRTLNGTIEEVHRVLEVLLPYLAVHTISTITTKEFIHLLLQYMDTTNRTMINGVLKHFIIEILEELIKNPSISETTKQRLITVLTIFLREIPEVPTHFSAILTYLQKINTPLPLQLLQLIRPNWRGISLESRNVIRQLAVVFKTSSGNPAIVGNAAALLIRLVSTNHIPRTQIDPMLSSLQPVVSRTDLIAPHLRMTVLTDCLTLYGNEAFQYLSPKARITVLNMILALAHRRVDDYLAKQLLYYKWTLQEHRDIFVTLLRDAENFNLPVGSLQELNQILLVVGATTATNPTLQKELYNIAVKLNSRPPEQSKYPRSVQYLIDTLLKRKPIGSVANIPQAEVTALSYVHWPTLELPTHLLDDLPKEVKDHDYKIVSLTKGLFSDISHPTLDATVRGNLLLIATYLLTTDQMTVSLAERILSAMQQGVALTPDLSTKNSLVLLQNIPIAITRPIIRSLPSVRTDFLGKLLHNLIIKAKQLPKSILETLIKFLPSHKYLMQIASDVAIVLSQHSNVPEQVELSRNLAKTLEDKAGSNPDLLGAIIGLLTKFKDTLSSLVSQRPSLKPVVQYIHEILLRLRNEPRVTALSRLKEYLQGLPGAVPVELVHNIFGDFPSWTRNDLNTIVAMVQAAVHQAKQRKPEVIGSLTIVAMRLLRLHNYTDNTEKMLVDIIDQMPVSENLIPEHLKLVLVNDILFVLATKVSEGSVSHVNPETLLRMLDAVLRSHVSAATASVENHFIKAVAAFVDNKFVLRQVKRELRIRLADLLQHLDFQHLIPMEIVVSIDKELRRKIWTVISKVHTTTEERSLHQFLQYLKTAHSDEIVRMDNSSMMNLHRVMLPLPPRALRNVIIGVEDVLKVNHIIVHKELAEQLLTIVQTAIRSPMFPAKSLPKAKSIMDDLQKIRNTKETIIRGHPHLYPPAM